MSLFKDGSGNLFDLKYADFVKKIGRGEIVSVFLVAHGDGGFYILTEQKNSDVLVRYVLSTKTGEMRQFKNLDTAHELIVAMGIKEYRCQFSNWNRDSAYNPHKASTESRRKKLSLL